MKIIGNFEIIVHYQFLGSHFQEILNTISGVFECTTPTRSRLHRLRPPHKEEVGGWRGSMTGIINGYFGHLLEILSNGIRELSISQLNNL